MPQCSECRHYHALKGDDPAAGWCEFIVNENVPFWMEARRLEIDRMGADVLATDGAECAAFDLEK